MKSIILFATALVLFSFNLQAQNLDYKSNLSINVGGSTVGAILKSLDVAEINIDNFEISSINTTGTPVLELNYDHGINNWFSIGVAGAYQQFQTSLEGMKTAEGATEQIDINLNRVNVAVRPLFHYYNKERLDLYGGLRIGWTQWSANSNATDKLLEEDIVDELPGIGGFRLQAIPFGMRYYMTENFGFNGELAIGSPHFISGGLNYRF